MNIGNITSDNFNLDGNGKDIQIEVYEQLIEQLQQENKQLKDNQVRAMNKIRDFINDANCEIKESKYSNEYVDKLLNQQKEFILYLENEKDRLARECSQIYEDSLGKTRLVNEDIFDEVDKILSKYKEIIGDKE